MNHQQQKEEKNKTPKEPIKSITSSSINFILNKTRFFGHLKLNNIYVTKTMKMEQAYSAFWVFY